MCLPVAVCCFHFSCITIEPSLYMQIYYRAVDDHYLEILANHCPNLEQLDLLGASITQHSVNE